MSFLPKWIRPRRALPWGRIEPLPHSMPTKRKRLVHEGYGAAYIGLAESIHGFQQLFVLTDSLPCHKGK